MACDFAAYRIAGSRQVVLVHETQASAVPPDTGFGAARGASKVTVQIGSGAEQDLPAYTLWLPTTIIAELPANLPDGPATLRVKIANPVCNSSAVLGDAGTVLPSDLVFAIAVPEAATPGQVIEVVNLKPGFKWAQSHTPVRLHRLDGTTSFPVTVSGGIGGARLRLTLPDAATLALPAPVEQFLLSFGSDPQRIALTVTKAVDVTTLPEWADLAFATPSLARPGQTVTLDVLEPPPPVFPTGTKFKFKKADLGDLVIQLPGQPQKTIQASGWEGERLTFTVPPAADLGLPVGVDTPTVLKFANRSTPIPLTISVPPLPALAFWLRVGTLTCRRKNEASTDEMQIVFRIDNIRQDRIPAQIPGAEEWHNFPNAGSFRTYDTWIGPFTQGIDVELWEVDNGRGAIIDADDQIQVHRVGAAATGQPADLTFKGEGAEYTLSHFVSSFPVGQIPPP